MRTGPYGPLKLKRKDLIMDSNNKNSDSHINLRKVDLFSDADIESEPIYNATSQSSVINTDNNFVRHEVTSDFNLPENKTVELPVSNNTFDSEPTKVLYSDNANTEDAQDYDFDDWDYELDESGEYLTEDGQQTKKINPKFIIIIVISAIVVAVLALLGGNAIGSMIAAQTNNSGVKNIEASDINRQQDPYEANPSSQNSATTFNPDNIQANCVHDWQPVIQTRDIPAETKTVDVPEVTETYTAYHTVCNTCKAIIDGAVKEHQSKTGHSGYTTGVPRQETRVITPATTKTEEISPARTEKFWNQEKCSKCGAVRDVQEQIVEQNSGD